MIGNLTRCIGTSFPYRKLGQALDNALGLPYGNHDSTRCRKDIPNIMIQLVIAHEKRISDGISGFSLNIPCIPKFDILTSLVHIRQPIGCCPKTHDTACNN